MEGWAGWIIQIVTTLAVGIIGFFIKRTLSHLEKASEQQGKRLDKLEDDYHKTLEALPLNYVLRDDFIRTVARLDDKLDKILDKISELKG